MIAGVSITTLLLVLVAGIGAGFVGYAVGASSLISYPALLAFGIPPVLSNTTNTVGVCGTGIGGLLSARKELKGQGRRVAVYACIGLVGGIIGGYAAPWMSKKFGSGTALYIKPMYWAEADGPSTITSRTSCKAGPTRARFTKLLRAMVSIHTAPAKVLPDPRPPSSSHVRQSGRVG